MTEEKFVVIFEHKAEEPLVGEIYLSHANEESAYKRYEALQNDPKIIRVCIAKLSYVTGNNTLLPIEPKE